MTFDASTIARQAREHGGDVLSEVVGQLAGYASTCWEGGTGDAQFQSEQAGAAVTSTLEWLRRDAAIVAWPSYGGLTLRRAKFVYEAARLQAAAVDAPVVPEPWFARDDAFRHQFLDVIAKQCGPDRSGDPERLHQEWVEAYERMGWRYGEVRDPVAKTHPDMVPFAELEQREQDKDAVFVALCELARLWIRE